ncbi:MAG: metallophosphoesterase family protein [Thermoleophilaceae bacterium]
MLSDVHGNLPALRAVLGDVDGARTQALWCLGDLVGYGARPDECVRLVSERCDVCLAGNHDLGVVDHIDIADFSPQAAQAARWTRDHADRSTLEFLGGLDSSDEGQAVGPSHEREVIGLYHASPRDPVWEYVLSGSQAAECMDYMGPRVAAIGHSHVALRFTRSDGRMEGEAVAGGTRLDLSEGDWLVNPGSVGQPRDGDPRAAWLLLDTEGWTAEWRRVEYPVAEAAAAIEKAGLPTSLGERLYLGQ